MLTIIPSAGIGSRLDLHTKHFNKSMIQLGDTPVISKIIDFYPKKNKVHCNNWLQGGTYKRIFKISLSKKKY